MKKYLKYIVGALIIFLLVAQFFPIDKTNPKTNPSKDFITITNPSEAVKLKLENACYDCHSDKTKYPWYTNIAPVSWWIKGHIDEGKKHLNFSIWGNYKTEKQDHKLDECIEYVEEKRMPLFSYTIPHPDAKMSSQERAEMVAFFKSLKK